jgi:DNA polymerase V
MQPLETNFTWRVDQMQKINLNPMVTEEKSLLSPQTKDLAVRYITGEYYKRIKDAGFRISELGLPEDCPPEVKHGKNAIVKGLDFEVGATAIERNEQIGGHKA